MIATSTSRRTTEPFREEHVAIKEHLRHMSRMIESIPGVAPEVRKQNMTKLVEALKGHILPHAEWEEKVLYPVIDQKTGSGKYVFTAAMRHEHRIVERWIDQLASESEKGTPDTVSRLPLSPPPYKSILSNHLAGIFSRAQFSPPSGLTTARRTAFSRIAQQRTPRVPNPGPHSAVDGPRPWLRPGTPQVPGGNECVTI